MAVVPLDDRPFPRALRDPEWQVEAVPEDEWPDLSALLKLMLDDEL
jgi:hypothetical protein